MIIQSYSFQNSQFEVENNIIGHHPSLFASPQKKTKMSKTLLVFIFAIITLAYAQYPNCAKLGSHKVEWVVSETRVDFKASVANGQKGWVALSVGPETTTFRMNNLTLAMGFKNGTDFHVNEYYFNSDTNNVGRPIIYTAQEKQMTADTVADNGAEGLTLTFSRPLTSTVHNYHPIVKGKKVRVTVAYNLDTTPKSATEWSKHSKLDGKDVDLFAPFGVSECNSASTPTIVLFTFFVIALTYLF